MLPTPPGTIEYYIISNNRLSGEIPSSICDLGNIVILDLADNYFTGVLPTCILNFSSTLYTLSLSGNNFSGRIPEFNEEQCGLNTLDLSSNSFVGPLPMSVTSCKMLMYVNFGMNKITDTFPSWLGSLPKLRVLMLHSNMFHGVMEAPHNDSWFPSLNVITLSENKFGGSLPAGFFTHLPAMKYVTSWDDEYPGSFVEVVGMKIMDRGLERQFGKTLGYFTLVHFLPGISILDSSTTVAVIDRRYSLIGRRLISWQELILLWRKFLPDMSMYIRVKRSKTTYFIQCEPTEAILSVKEKLQSLIDQPVNDQRLILLETGDVLEDSKSLADQKVENDAVVALTLRKDDNEFEEVNIIRPHDFSQSRDGDGGNW
ncbi:hypothetical protein MLD38_015290 [Melastoma candidum]|uniref:Uncharacterized protein n=1 Tax=Melastoma candidum TaxID=119954 RepID=A0ACB9RG83_9MYRT|nr:hypothetical protein MLD38_015290 [Melastoma candidum]